MQDSIAKAVIEKFKSFNKQEQFTILAGVVIDKGSGLECISIGTGTKVLSDKLIDKNGLLVRDLHAKVSCRRNLKRYLIHQLQSPKSELCTYTT